jgi:hypothetical protein
LSRPPRRLGARPAGRRLRRRQLRLYGSGRSCSRFRKTTPPCWRRAARTPTRCAPALPTASPGCRTHARSRMSPSASRSRRIPPICRPPCVTLDKTGLGHLTPPETTSRGVELFAVCGAGPTPPNASLPEPLRHPRSLKNGHLFVGPIPDVWQEMRPVVLVVPDFGSPAPQLRQTAADHVHRADRCALGAEELKSLASSNSSCRGESPLRGRRIDSMIA